MTIQIEKKPQKILAIKGRLKRYRERVKQYRQKETFRKNDNKFNRQLGGDSTKTCQQSDAREAKQLWCKIWQQRDITKKPNG